ncbi:putative nhp2 non-histone chromosome protein 2-like 1 protein [Neofusicoccum parvum UCRNP2]|uniref:H/ACA ribonucleoprotein complex subunit 2 n=1 Tax=Botryosphaeria parva (strain UCR-NP2) TaxID=1287680 RepID=R1ELT8_BOTPV|nr:putative nhp2 non-histone chromosome protein 2-like 1 protein [Neofusicoccum parvum UCRNP2]
MSNQPIPNKPTASPTLTHDILHLVSRCSLHKQLHKGTTDTTRSLARGTAQLVVLAADAQAPDAQELLQVLCAERAVPHVFIASKAALGRACGVSGDVVLVAVTADQGSAVGGFVRAVMWKVERLMAAAQVEPGEFLVAFGF